MALNKLINEFSKDFEISYEECEEVVSIDQKQFVYTFTGRINKEDLFNLSVELLHQYTILHYDPTTVLEIYDEFDKEDSGDEILDDFSSMTLFPVRIMVLKTLVFYSNQEEIGFFAEFREHKALTMMQEAKKRKLEHATSFDSSSTEVQCSCNGSTFVTNTQNCVYCNTVVCSTCSMNPCAFTLQEVIEDMDCGEQDSSDEGEEDMDCDI